MRLATAVLPASVLAAFAIASHASVRDAGACSCMSPHAAILTPDRVDDAPLDTKVRLEVPTSVGPVKPRVVLRAHGGADVAVTTRTSVNGALDTIELTPSAPLAASTQYEVAVVYDQQHPSTFVLGTFKTGTATDTTPPRIDKLGAVTAQMFGGFGSSCSIPGPWIDVETIAASDPSRPKAQLVFGVWRGNAAGVIDATKPPEAIVRRGYGDGLTIGRRSMCDPHDFALPRAGVVWLGIAAIDEAGNASPMKRVQVNMSNAAPPKRTP